ncbi:sensor histidine kinase [Fructilactobacillus vespulae]|uniref:sensor histidine kinase n=1 Tax=Fructilactobacillus vespulae TaxID=1249630 RepID=UPI0039B54129
MVSLKKWFYLFWEQKTIFFTYLFIVFAITLVSHLYNYSIVMVQDLVSFTWLPILIAILYRMLRENATLNELKKNQQESEKMPFHHLDPLLNSYRQLLKQQNERAEQAEKIAHLNERNLIDYLITWSHEMKLPIASLSLMAEQAEALDSDQVYKQVLIMNNQLDSLLTYERLNDFSHDLEFGWYSLNDTITNVIKEYSTFFIEKQLAPALAVHDVKILTDQKWLYFIIKQIIYNAIKYANPQTKIDIKMVGQELHITNEGLPISASDLPRIFESGFTGENGRKQQSATGMGLYLVKRVSEKLNLKVAAASANDFTTITITFPKSTIKK